MINLKLSDDNIRSIRKDCRGWYHMRDTIECFIPDGTFKQIENRINKIHPNLLNHDGTSLFECHTKKRNQKRNLSRCRCLNPDNFDSIGIAIQNAILDMESSNQKKSLDLKNLDKSMDAIVLSKIDDINQSYYHAIENDLNQKESDLIIDELCELRLYEEAERLSLETFEESLMKRKTT